MSKRGRPTKFTEPIRARIIEAISIGSSYQIACNYAGISRDTLHRWMVKGQTQRTGLYRTFYDDIKKAEARGAVSNLAVIQNEARRGNWKCSAWLLERRWGFRKDAVWEDEIPDEQPKQLPSSPLEILRQQALDIQVAIKQAMQAQSWQAYAALQRQFVQVIETIQTIEAEEQSQDSLQSASDDEIKAHTVSAIISLPPIMRQEIIEELARFSNVVAMKK
jgi:hypothetical protein